MSISKTFSSETSGRYASAIFEVAEEAKEFDQTEKDLRSILILYNSNKYLSDFIKNPTQNIKSQESLILKISEVKLPVPGPISKIFLSLISTISMIFLIIF